MLRQIITAACLERYLVAGLIGLGTIVIIAAAMGASIMEWKLA